MNVRASGFGSWVARAILSTLSYMGVTMPITEPRARFGSLIRRALHARERVTITDHGQPAAVLINPLELADLEEALALARYRNRLDIGRIG